MNTARFFQVGGLLALLVLTLAACGTDATVAEVDELRTTGWFTMRIEGTDLCLTNFSGGLDGGTCTNREEQAFRFEDKNGQQRLVSYTAQHACVNGANPLEDTPYRSVGGGHVFLGSCDNEGSEKRSPSSYIVDEQEGALYTIKFPNLGSSGEVTSCLDGGSVRPCSDSRRWQLEGVWYLAGQ